MDDLDSPAVGSLILRAIWRMQPTLPVATTVAPVASMWSILRRPSRSDISGWVRL